MKSLYYILGIALLFLVTSCAVTESMILREDGSGKFAFELDASELMALGGEKSTSDKPQTMDSIISFKQILAEKKDSIAKLSPEEQARIKKMENFNMHVVLNEPEGVMKYSFYTEFKKIAELNEVMGDFKEVASNSGSLNQQFGGMGSLMGENKSKATFIYDGKNFTKKVELIVFEDPEPSEVEEVVEIYEVREDDENEVEYVAEEDNYEEELQPLTEGLEESMGMIMEQTKFKVKYTFPKPVKKVHSSYEVLYSDYWKTITIEMPIKVYMEGVDKSNLEVEFE